MIRLDMSEYMERHTVSKLIGSPPGYVGYGYVGTLIEAIRQRPLSIIFLDEIEKSHPNISNILFQVLEVAISLIPKLEKHKILTFLKMLYET